MNITNATLGSIHTRERFEGESFADYKARRAHSNAILAANIAPCQAESAGHNPKRNAEREERRLAKFARITNSQKLKAVKPRKHKRAKPLMQDGFAVTLTGKKTQFIDCAPGLGWLELGRESSPESTVIIARRIWMGGISARRGF